MRLVKELKKKKDFWHHKEECIELLKPLVCKIESFHLFINIVILKIIYYFIAYYK